MSIKFCLDVHDAKSELVYYEYVQQPCVQQLFYHNAKTVSSKVPSKGTLCDNPNLPIAAAACCEKTGNKSKTYSNTIYDGERMTFASAVSRCDKASMEACNFDSMTDKSHKLSSFFWTLDDSSIKLKVNSKGRASILHQSNLYTETILHVGNKNGNWFKLYWNNGEFPTPSKGCNGVCTTYKNICLFNYSTKLLCHFHKGTICQEHKLTIT